jgi:hypothetical protein
MLHDVLFSTVSSPLTIFRHIDIDRPILKKREKKLDFGKCGMTRLAAVVADDWAGWNAELSKWLME